MQYTLTINKEVTVTRFPIRLHGFNLLISLIITRGIKITKDTMTDTTLDVHGNIFPSILQNAELI